MREINLYIYKCVIINEEMRDFPLPYLIQRLPQRIGKRDFLKCSEDSSCHANWMRMVGFH